LAVNSAKHGALAHGGRLKIGATIAAGKVTIVWHETSSQPVKAQSREGGQGMKLIDRIVRTRRGRLDIAWRPDGLDVTIAFDLAE
jgi:two-component sensor histidine kinase